MGYLDNMGWRSLTNKNQFWSFNQPDKFNVNSNLSFSVDYKQLFKKHELNLTIKWTF